jgi:CheY-like chemotaxis protein
MLKRKVERISRAKNGDEVIEYLKRESPDLILMDLKMPGMNGYEATREIRKSNLAIPIIALTAYSQPEEKKLAAEAGCTAFISKPIRKEQLFKELKRILFQVSRHRLP